MTDFEKKKEEEVKASAKKVKEPKVKKEKIKKTKTPMSKEKFMKMLMGSKDDMGLLKKIAVYVILISVGFIFLYPILQMVATSFMSYDDLMNSSITWIASDYSFENYRVTMAKMDYFNALLDSVALAGLSTLCQIVVCSLVGYGLARYNFKGRTVIMLIIIISFIIPSQVLEIPIFVVYSQMGLTGTLLAFIIPALFVQGFKAQLFILICWSFFRQIPQVLNEAASIDGAGHIKQYFKIAIPSAKGALVVVALFSFVWYWNEDYLTTLYLYQSGSARGEITPLINKLQLFETDFSSAAISSSYGAQQTGVTINQSYSMCATVLCILPLLILYIILQKQFVESIDRAGITGE